MKEFKVNEARRATSLGEACSHLVDLPIIENQSQDQATVLVPPGRQVTSHQANRSKLESGLRGSTQSLDRYLNALEWPS